jgi:predicted ribosome quality control (RQC) complex YloA/Tae2 family protein
VDDIDEPQPELEQQDERDHDDERGAIVQEATCAEKVISLKVRSPGLTSFVIVGSAGEHSGAGIVTIDQRKEAWGGRLPPGLERQRAREDALVGARILAVGEREAFIDQHGDRRVVRADPGRVVVTDASPASIHKRGVRFPLIAVSDVDRADLEKRGAALLEAIAKDAVSSYRAIVVKILERATQKIDRRHEAIRGDIDKIAQADRIASQAQWLVAEAARAPRGATKLVVTDWSSGEAVPIVVPLDPSKSAKDQVEAMFKRAKRLRLGARIAEERLRQADIQRAGIEATRAKVNDGETLSALENLLRDAKRIAPRDIALPSHIAGGLNEPGSAAAATTKKKKSSKKQERTPYRIFIARSGKKILVGKGAADNDTLTLRVARPHDLWLHAKDRTGAHVVVMLPTKGQPATAEDLVDAAHLAAHFSEAREEKVVDVTYVDRRYVRKPRTSPPGVVLIDREKVLVLRMQPELLRALLEREDLPS